MSTAYDIESIDGLRKRRSVCAIFAQTRSNLRMQIALHSVSFARCLQKAYRARDKRTISLRIFSLWENIDKRRTALLPTA